jgi:hypothetical protein
MKKEEYVMKYFNSFKTEKGEGLTRFNTAVACQVTVYV